MIMMSLETIRDLSDKAASKAAKAKHQPLVLADPDRHPEEVFKVPFIGDYIPEGWTLEHTYFVDSSGMGAPGEPALTIGSFIDLVKEHPDDGWAMTAQGQFQIYVGRYRKAP